MVMVVPLVLSFFLSSGLVPLVNLDDSLESV